MNACRPDSFPPYEPKPQPKPEPRREPLWVARARENRLPVKVWR